VFVAEEKLTVQVAQVNGVEVNDVYFTEPSKQEVLEELAANSSSADEKDS
jgi:hypothetical protein